MHKRIASSLLIFCMATALVGFAAIMTANTKAPITEITSNTQWQTLWQKQMWKWSSKFLSLISKRSLALQPIKLKYGWDLIKEDVINKGGKGSTWPKSEWAFRKPFLVVWSVVVKKYFLTYFIVFIKTKIFEFISMWKYVIITFVYWARNLCTTKIVMFSPT